jgi:uncharacterized protein YdhG (YjbR/CyaY superfamily)
MPSAKKIFSTITEYEATLPVRSKMMFRAIRKVITAAIPGVEATISYNIPAFKYEGRIIVSVGVWKDHIGMYPVPSGSVAFSKAIERYRQGKSSVHFPINEPLPLKLIKTFVLQRLERNAAHKRIGVTMKQQNERASTVDEYLAACPPDVRAALQKIRTQVKKLVPSVSEKISYGMPTFFTHRALVGYAMHKDHCSFYPWNGVTLKNFTKELAGFETSAGTVRFTVNKPLPASLIKKIVLARLLEHGDKDKHSPAKNAVKKEGTGFPFAIAAPAQRALTGAHIRSLKDLAKRRESDVEALHGMGPKALGILRAEMKRAGLSFRK